MSQQGAKQRITRKCKAIFFQGTHPIAGSILKGACVLKTLSRWEQKKNEFESCIVFYYLTVSNLLVHNTFGKWYVV